jgi:hypothetical protein
MSYLVFMPKPSSHHMHDSRTIVPHIQPKVIIDNQMSCLRYNYYINNVSKGYDDSQQNRTTEDSITPQEQQLGQHVASTCSRVGGGGGGGSTFWLFSPLLSLLLLLRFLMLAI